MTRRWFQFSLRTAIVAMILAGVADGASIFWWPYYQAGRAFDNANNGEAFPKRAAVREALVHCKSFRDAVAECKGAPQITSLPTMDTANNLIERVYILDLKRGWVVYFEQRNDIWIATRADSDRHEDHAGDDREAGRR